MKAAKGFTLLELMVALVVVAILAALALPSYQGYVRKARRADAMDALLAVQLLQEKHRASHPAYGTLAEIGFGASTSLDGHYDIALDEEDISATGYTLGASAAGDQASDRVGEVSCEKLTITVDSENPRGAKTPKACWSR